MRSCQSYQTKLTENPGLFPGFCKMRRGETKVIDANAVILLNVLKLNYTPAPHQQQTDNSGQKKVMKYVCVANSK